MHNMLNPQVILTTEILMFLAGVVGYYWGHRGTTGVISDLKDVKQDLENVKAKVSATPTP